MLASSPRAAVSLKLFEIEMVPMTGRFDFPAAALRHCPTAFAPARISKVNWWQK
jgi:hypothetical protein